jgi:Thioredoxin like C-terminal domain
VNFWTLTCINWLRQEPHVRAWSRAYRDVGLIVIGVYTPEFSFEHEIDRIRQAIKERGIDHPIAVDSDYEIWSAFDNHYWPALYGEWTIGRENVVLDLVREHDAVRERTLQITFLEPGAEAYAFTFG